MAGSLFIALAAVLVLLLPYCKVYCLNHRISVRQIPGAPYFPQTSYTFQSVCTPGSLVGTITAISYVGGTVTYSADAGTGSSSYVQINPYTGQITLLTAPSGGFSFTFRATGSAGSAAVPVTVYCTGAITNPQYPTYATPTFTQTSYYFTVSSCTPGASVGQVYATNAVSYQITGSSNVFTISPTGAITLTGYPQPGTYSATVQAYGTNFGVPATAYITLTIACNGGYNVPTFPQSTYSFTVSSCTAGTPVGSIYATNAISYQISGGSNIFTIGSNGQITLTGYPTSGTYSATVQAYGSTGGTATAYVTVTITCNGNFPGFPTFPGIPTFPGTGGVTFSQSSYYFSSAPSGTGLCINPGAVIGNIFANGAYSYAITSGPSGLFTISPSGQITLATAATAGTYSLTVTAYGNGAPASVPVTISIPCNIIRRAPERAVINSITNNNNRWDRRNRVN